MYHIRDVRNGSPWSIQTFYADYLKKGHEAGVNWKQQGSHQGARSMQKGRKRGHECHAGSNADAAER